MDKIIVLDCGSQYTQLIARSIRSLNVACFIYPYNEIPKDESDIKGFIISGSPYSTSDIDAPKIDFDIIDKKPILGICYGAQSISTYNGGSVSFSNKREYGRANLISIQKKSPLLENLKEKSQVWMSHADTIIKVPDGAEVLAGTMDVEIVAFKLKNKQIFGVQFHPEVNHSLQGKQLLKNFIFNICRASKDWTPSSFIKNTISKLEKKINDDGVLLAISGGVDSTVAATLLKKAIGNNLHSFFINNGLLRKNEFKKVLKIYKDNNLNVTGIDAKKKFYSILKGVSDPTQKRLIIGRGFVEVFQKEAKKVKNIKWLGQGTIYPDVIESQAVVGPSKKIKSHHNVGGLPQKMNLKLVEPLKYLFKDEIRKIGKELGLKKEFLHRHPFPGPGLAVRIIGDITEGKVKILQEVDEIFINELIKDNLYDKVWQAAAILLPIKSVGVMGDSGTYENVVAIRCVNSVDGMTADWSRLPNEFLGRLSNKIINNVKGVNRVVYDITTKPPATIEWE